MAATAKHFIDGTTALNRERDARAPRNIIRPDFNSVSKQPRFAQRARQRARAVADGSEMLCSLRFEDARGVAYNVFSRRECIVAGMVLVAFAVVALALG